MNEILPPSAEDWDSERRIAELRKLESLQNEPRDGLKWGLSVFECVRSLMPSPFENQHGSFHDEAETLPTVYLKKKTYYSATMQAYRTK